MAPNNHYDQTIAIDIDDVIAESTNALRLLVNERTGADLTREHYMVEGEYRGYYSRVWQEHGLSDKISFEQVAAEMAIDQSHVPLLPGASFAVHELSKRFHIILITARDPIWEKETRRWFKDHFAQDDIEVYFIGYHKTDTSKTKGQLCRDLGASLLIDDNPEHCQSVIDEGIKAILFGEYGWHTTIPKEAIICKDWPAVMEYINDSV